MQRLKNDGAFAQRDAAFAQRDAAFAQRDTWDIKRDMLVRNVVYGSAHPLSTTSLSGPTMKSSECHPMHQISASLWSTPFIIRQTRTNS